MSTDEFPSFQKKKATEKLENKWASTLLIVGALLFTALLIFFTFRFLIGSKTPREEMLAKILSASPSGQSSLLMEWMGNIEHSTEQKHWTPSSLEQQELLRLSYSKISDLKQQVNSPALYALHVASWGPGVEESKELRALRETSVSEEATLALALYMLRQGDFSEEALKYFEPLSASSNEAIRKVGGMYFTRCVASGGRFLEPCRMQMLRLLGDSSDEVRWNVALGVLREHSKAKEFSQSEIEKAADEIGKLYVLIRNGDPTLLSRFNGVALESLAREVFTQKYELSPNEMKQELAEISRSHKDLRIRNLARSLELKFQEK